MGSRINIAIDGPAGAGKSTVAKLLAEKLSFVYIDTGAMYRALTWKAVQENIPYEDDKALADILMRMNLQLENSEQGQRIYVDGKDVSEEVRVPAISNNVSYVARHGVIRNLMVRKQQELASAGGTVMDGRDIGTAVLPDASVKFFLNASVEERAKRRYEEQIKKGIPSDFESLKEEIELRDKLDTERDVAPLKKADDALAIDTTHMTINEVVDYLYERSRRKADMNE